MHENESGRDATPSGDAEAAAPPPPPRKEEGGRRKWPALLVAGLLGIPLLIFIAWTAIALNFNYSEGDRAGFIQKFSRKGWICKTWEGDLAQVSMPGAAPEHFLFTVRNDSVAQEITKLSGSRVSLSYKEHPGVPGTCFGDTNYFVTGVKAIP